MLQTSEENARPYNADGVRRAEWVTPAQAAAILDCDESAFRNIRTKVSSTRKPGGRRLFYSAHEVQRVADIVASAGITLPAAAKVMAALRDGRLRW